MVDICGDMWRYGEIGGVWGSNGADRGPPRGEMGQDVGRCGKTSSHMMPYGAIMKAI